MSHLALWVGDSFTAGEGANLPESLTYPHVVSERLGWKCRVDAQNGTGFVNDGFAASPNYAPLIQRLSDNVRQFNAEIVVVDAGRNDVDAATPVLEGAVVEYVNALHGAYPAARIVFVIPSLISEVQPPEYLGVGAVLCELASTCDVTVVDPARAGAFGDPRLNQELVSGDGFHPSARGQERYAESLEQLLRQALL